MAFSHPALAGGKRKGGGGGGGGQAAHPGGGGGGGRGAIHSGGGQRALGGNAGQHANARHGLNRTHNQNSARGLGTRGRGNLRNAHARSFAGRGVHRLGARGGVGHWRSGLRWRNSHVLFSGYRRAWHNSWWWRWHYSRVVLIGGGWYYWDGGYWFPAWGYDPLFTAYVYDGPIYSYANLPPDEVIVNVQEILQDQGYYAGDVDGQLGQKTRDAIGAYQADHALEVTSAVDEPTVQSLGLNS
ncbi:MAG: localization factor PodJL [Verrucomicrobiota bacterium]